MNTNTIEFFKDPAQAEENQILPQAVAPGLKPPARRGNRAYAPEGFRGYVLFRG